MKIFSRITLLHTVERPEVPQVESFPEPRTDRTKDRTPIVVLLWYFYFQRRNSQEDQSKGWCSNGLTEKKKKFIVFSQ